MSDKPRIVSAGFVDPASIPPQPPAVGSWECSCGSKWGPITGFVYSVFVKCGQCGEGAEILSLGRSVSEEGET